MKKSIDLKKNSGITLITLVITIIVLLILATVATYSGIEAIENTKYTRFKSELRIMQTYVNDWYEDLKPIDTSSNTFEEEFNNNIEKKFGKNDNSIVKADNASIDEDAVSTLQTVYPDITQEEINKYYVLDSEQKDALGIEGVSQIVLVNIRDRKVVSYFGLDYKGKMYYTLDDLGEVYNVGYENKNSSKNVGFSVKTEVVKYGQAKISVYDITYEGYNDKWKVKYKKEDDNLWKTSKDMSFIVTEGGNYKIQLINQNEDIVGEHIENISVSTQMPVYAMLYTGGDDSDLELVLSSNTDIDTSTRTRKNLYKGPWEISRTLFENANSIPWKNDASSIKEATIENKIQPQYAKMLFNNCVNLETINNLRENLDTTYVSTMESMFDNCKKLQSIDLSNFNTSKVTNMANMFHNCLTLTELDVSKFNTSNVTTMKGMFSSDRTDDLGDGMALTQIDGLNKFNTQNVTDMANMFSMCRNITQLDVSSFDTSKVTDMSFMFGGLWGNRVYDMKLENIIGLEKFDTSNVVNMEGMFQVCGSLTSLNLSNFNTSKVEKMGNMFLRCVKLSKLNLNSFDTSNVKDMSWMFRQCTSLKELELVGFNTAKVEKMNLMFYNCSNLTTIYASNKFVVSLDTNSSNMFGNVTKIVGGAGTTYDASHTDKTYAHIDGGTSNPGYFSDK